MTGDSMTTESTTEQAGFDKDRSDDESIRGDQRVAWYGSDECELCPPADSPIRIGEVHELVSVMLKHAPFDQRSPSWECVVEVKSHRAWCGFVDLVRQIDEEVGMILEPGWS
jgi:hypothetical protein